MMEIKLNGQQYSNPNGEPYTKVSNELEFQDLRHRNSIKIETESRIAVYQDGINIFYNLHQDLFYYPVMALMEQEPRKRIIVETFKGLDYDEYEKIYVHDKTGENYIIVNCLRDVEYLKGKVHKGMDLPEQPPPPPERPTRVNNKLKKLQKYRMGSGGDEAISLPPIYHDPFTHKLYYPFSAFYSEVFTISWPASDEPPPWGEGRTFVDDMGEQYLELDSLDEFYVLRSQLLETRVEVINVVAYR